MTATLETRTTPTWDQYRGRLEEYFDRTALDAWAPVPTGLADAGAAAGKAAGWWAAAAVTSAPLMPVNVLAAALVGRAVEGYRRRAA